MTGPGPRESSHQGARPTVSAVVLAYGDEPLLSASVEAILSSRRVDADVVIVDNGCVTDAVDRLESVPGVTVVRPGTNTGYAAGCNLGARHARGEFLAFVNGDAVVDTDALALLIDALGDPEVGIASGSVRLYDDPSVINSAGNPVHFLGLSWAGALGEPASAHAEPRNVAGASGAGMVVSRETWDSLGGLCEPMFLYLEDTELSLRCWLAGRQVRYVPDAVVLHRYEFSRNPGKLYLLERNRLFVVLTIYRARTLVVLAPGLLALEVAMALVAMKQSWFGEKAKGWWWLVRHARTVRRRRSWVQAGRRISDSELAAILTARFEPGAESGIPRTPLLSTFSEAYWRVARRCLD